MRRLFRAPRGLVAVMRRAESIGLAQVLFETGSVPLVTRALFQAEQMPSLQAGLLAEWVRQYGLQRARAVGVLSRESYLLFPAEAPDLPRAEWSLNMRWKIADRIHYPPEQAVVELFDLPGSAAQAESGKIYVAVAQESTVQEEVALFLQAGLSLLGIDILDLSLGRLTDALPEDGRGLGLLYWTAAGGVVSVRRNRTLYLARGLETGRRQIGRALADSGSPTALQGDPFVLDELAAELRRTFDFYENNFLQPPLEKLFIVPAGKEGLELPTQWAGSTGRDRWLDDGGYAWQESSTPAPAPGLWNAHLEELLCDELSARLGLGVEPLPLRRLLRWSAEVQEADLMGCLPAVGAALDWGAA
ncbi:MAG: hypothetical protein H7837_07470 [Magnetococcus sp. MYC-9]